MELEDSWDPDPLPNSNVRNHSQPRSKGQAARNSRMQPQYYQHSQTSYPQQRGRNAPMDLSDDFSDDESSSNEYAVVLQQPQVNHKRTKSPAQPVPDRRKRHQSEHPSGIGRGRTTNIEEAMHDHNPEVSHSRKKSAARNDIRYKATENNHHDGYLGVENNFPTSRKSHTRSHSRARDAYEDQGYMEAEDYNEQFARESSFIAYQGNLPAKRRTKEEPIYNSVPPPGTFSHESTGRHRQQSSRANHEPVVTPKARHRLDYSRAQSAGPRSPYDDGGNLYLGTENGMSSARSRRQRQEPQLASPPWPNHKSVVQKPAPACRQQGNIEKPAFVNSLPHTPRNQSVRSRSVAPNRTQTVASQPREYDYGSINDDDVNEISLENALRGRPNFQMKVQNSPMNVMNALPNSSAFRSSNSKATKQVYQSPPRNLNGAVASKITIDLVTPESAVSARGSMPFIPQHWTPARRGPIKVSTPLKDSMQDGPGSNSVEKFTEDVRERQAVASSTNNAQRPEEVARQRRAAEKIVQKELIADRETLQKELFGEVVSETEEERRERDEAKRFEAQRSREEKEKQDAIDAEAKRQKNELKTQKEREKKDAEQREKDKDVASTKAKRDAERHHQSLMEAQGVKQRRKVACDIRKAKKEGESALQKALDEQKLNLDKERKEQAAEINKMKRNMQKLAAQVTAQTAAALKPARKSTSENGSTSAANTSPPQATLSTNMAVDDEDSLFLPETQITTVEASPDQQAASRLQIPEASNSDSTIVRSVEQDQAPASIAEIFAKTIPNTSGGNFLEDREAEREAIRKNRPDERGTAKRKREKSVPAEPSPTTTARKAAPRATSKAPSKATPKKSCTLSLTQSPGSSVFDIKLKPLHGPDAFVPREQPEQPSTIEKATVDLPVVKPRPLPLPPPPPKPTANSIRPETKFISQAERDKIEADRERIQAEAKARKDALTKQQADARKDGISRKKTVEYRKKKEKEFRDKARQDGKVLSEFELETMLDKLMERRERDKTRRNQRRLGEKASSSEHEHDAVSNSSLPNGFGTAAQVSSSDTASESNHMEEDDDPETQARKEHEARTAESLKALAESRAARRSQVSPVEKLGPLFSDDSSSESEEDPDDEETTERLIEHARKNAAVTKATNNANVVQPENQIVEEVDLEKDFEAAFEEELLIEGEPEMTTAALNPDDHSAQVIEPMPDMTAYFEGSSTQRSSYTLAEQSTQLTRPSQISQPERAKPQNPASYSMVNVYMVMTQLTLHEHEDEAALKKKFFDVDKANRYAQTLVNEYRTKKYMQQEIVEKWDQQYKYSCQIIHNNHKITKVFVKAVPMNPKEIDKYDPREIHPKFANQYYTVRYEKTIEQLDPETQKVCMTERTVGITDDNKLYTALEMANHAAAEYLLERIKPKEEVEEHHTLYEEELLSQVRTERDNCTKREHMFCCELDSDTIPWADFKSFGVKVELYRTEGPIN
ncbi:hypothetical protein EAF04_007138 [Stromatinia cepivora]|nr:hypothetical protein EAF04_007138 [Stromatinia cepivora]